jgi:MoxR-like ATPase
VLATQNPIEQEGTYPLPEAQLDRFMFNIWVDYPSAEEEEQIVGATTAGRTPEPSPVLTKRADASVAGGRAQGPRVPARHQVRHPLVRATRPGNADAPELTRPTSPPAPVRAPASTSSSPPRPWPCWRAGFT